MGFIIKSVKSVFKAVKSVVGGVFGFLVGGVSKSKQAKSQNNLNKSLEPETHRKIAFGKIAAPLDLRFWQVWGTNSNNYDEVIALATHRIHSVKELYCENELAITETGVVSGKYVGVLSRDFRLGTSNQTALSVGNGAQWTNLATFDGCPHMVLKWLPDEKKLPNGIPNRLTQVIEGALVYDPRRDSTVPGGNGTHRIDNQDTWAYATLDGNGQPIGRNNALQALWYLIGWRIPKKDINGNLTGETELVAGRGVVPEDINLATFISGANACESAGYYTDMLLSTEDEHTANENKITADGLIGRLIDPGGLWSYYANVDDTANIAVEITDADILDSSGIQWNDFKPISEQYNQIGGKYVNPSPLTLFQPFPYPLVRDANYEANLGRKVRKTIDFQQVLDGTLAQRLARLKLNEGQYQGEFSGPFNYRLVKAQAWSIVRYTSERFGWTKLFRVWKHELSTEKGVQLLLKEIHASIWSAGTVTPPMVPGEGAAYNPNIQLDPATVTVSQVTSSGLDGTLVDGLRVSWAAPPTNARRIELRYKVSTDTHWLTANVLANDITSCLLSPLLPGTQYNVQVRFISIHEIPGNWVSPVGAIVTGSNGNANATTIAAASSTAIWSNVTGPGRPNDNADVTALNIAAGIEGQGPGATAIPNDVLNYNESGDVVQISRPGGGWFRAETANVLGSIKITLPVSYNNLMMRFVVDIYDYSSNQMQTYIIGGHNYSGGYWSGTSANFFGREQDTKQISFGFDGVNVCVWIGSVSSSWSYLVVVVKDFVSRGGTASQLKDNWQISIDSVGARNVNPGNGFVNTILRPRAGDVVFGESILETQNGSIATLAGFKTNLGVSSGFTGQGALATQNNVNLASQVSGKLGATNASFDLINANISILANGQLAGAGGGSVTLNGLGFLGDVNSTNGDNLIINSGMVSNSNGWGQPNNLARIQASNGDPSSYWRTIVSGSHSSVYMNNANLMATLGASKLFVSFWARFSLLSSATIRAYFNFFKAGVYHSSATLDQTANLTNVWILKTGEVLIPLGCDSFNVYFFAAGTNGLVFEVASPRVSFTEFLATKGGAFDNNLLETQNGSIATLAGFKTNLGVSSGFTGQGALATQNSLAYGGAYLSGFGSLAARNNARLGGEIYRIDGTTLVYDNDAITSLGVASGIAGQGALATLNAAAWSSNVSGRPTELTDGRVSAALSSAGRVNDGRSLNSNNNFGLRALSVTPTMSASVVGGTSATITFASDGILYSDWGASYTLPSASFPGLALSTRYYFWRNMPTPDNIGSSYGYSLTLTDALGTGKVYLGFYTTPVSSGTGGGGGGFGGDDCVIANAYVLLDNKETFAHNVKFGDLITVLDDALTKPVLVNCEANKLSENECCTLITESGVRLTLAINTPITLVNGFHALACNSIGQLVAVQDNGDFRFEKIADVVFVGKRKVAKITCRQKTYAAGDESGKYIFTHNIFYKP